MTAYLTHVADVPFPLGRPENLPTRRAELVRYRGIAAAGSAALNHESAEELLESVRATRSRLAVPVGAEISGDPAESEANRDNDLAFGIVRTDGDAGALLVNAALAALAGVLDLAVRRGIGVPHSSWTDLVAGFRTLFDWFADVEPGAANVPPVTTRQAPEPLDALRRWVRGHHVFMVFAEACAVAHACVRTCAEDDDLDGARTAATAATRLMIASRAALQFAGDVDQLEYREEIRPTLMPPIAPPKMSGLHWRDHEALVDQMAAARDGWAWLAARDPQPLHDFRVALDETYLAHQGVCEHFVGPDSPSLLATARSSRPAVGVLRQFQTLRAELLPEEAR